MKQRNVFVAAAVAAVLGTGAAQALAPSAPIQYTLYEGGGSAQENAAFYAFATILQTNTIDVYTDATNGKASSNYLIVSGTVNSTAATSLGIPSGSNLLLFYRFAAGGSLPNGIIPFTQTATTGTLPYPQISSITNSTATTNASPATSPANPTYQFTATDAETGNLNAPDWGLSDVEISVLNTTYNLNNTTPLTTQQIGNVAQDPIYDDVSGVAVTNNLYALKSKWSKAEVAGVLEGDVTNWNQLYGDNGQQLPSGPVWLLDRGSGSGSKSLGSQYFLNYPGGLLDGNYYKPHSVGVIAGNVNSGYTKINGVQLTAVNVTDAVYQDVKESSNPQIVNDLITINGLNTPGEYGIAVLSTEFAPNLQATPQQYSFVKINGTGIDQGVTGDNINGSAGTTYSNAITGSYDFVYQNSFNTRASGNTPQTASSLGAALIPLIDVALNSPAVAAAHTGNALPASVPGVLLDADKYATQTAGSILWSRGGHAIDPEQFSVAASSANIIFGNDPL